ncbi:hypothetical protein [Streptomyces caatingaensis]|uniref:Chaplin domain-containing protein n=1 Tax=Streptomyces caatingaensis TaxID=1678637 RepID=A0A0K9XL53_9ACTN|nr:hypothetical protein [Streptomyces caatingaensis]KNB54124.1 hypothetical protein AC230_06300 [Streptomyces caatingaensis]
MRRRFAIGVLAVAALLGALATPAGAEDWGKGGGGGESCITNQAHNLVGVALTCSPISVL